MRNLNLQFFADDVETTDVDTSVEMTESAEPSEVEETANESETETEEPKEETAEEPETVDKNAIAASVRRRAESEFKKREAQRDAEFAQRFGHLVNPITKQPIRSERDYLDALDAQEQLQREQKLRESGIDPQIIDDLVQKNPLVVQASKYMADAQQKEAEALVFEDVATLSKLDSSIRTLDDVPDNIVQTALAKGITLVEAYKIENYDKTTSAKEEAIRQSAINQVKNKAHLNPINGVATNDNSVEIPHELRDMWEQLFPNKTWAERKKLYNEQLK